MTIPLPDTKDFFRISRRLDAFFESRLHQLRNDSLEEIKRLRDTAFADPAHVEAYVKANPDNLPQSDLDEVVAWQKHTVSGRFLIHQEKKDGCLFSFGRENSPMEVYLVKGLMDSIGEMLPFLPIYAETRLLPFRGHIVTEGIIAPIMMRFSARMAKTFLAEVRESIATHGLITTLPAGAMVNPAEADLLKFYLSTAANRLDYRAEIMNLRSSSDELRLQYLKQTGKLNSKNLKNSLLAKGITGHFAVLEDTIIAGASEKSQAAACAAQLLPPGLLEAVVWIKL